MDQGIVYGLETRPFSLPPRVLAFLSTVAQNDPIIARKQSLPFEKRDRRHRYSLFSSVPDRLDRLERLERPDRRPISIIRRANASPSNRRGRDKEVSVDGTFQSVSKTLEELLDAEEDGARIPWR